MNFKELVRLSQDVQVKEFGDNKLSEFSIAYDTGYGDKKKPCFLEVKAWGKTGEVIASTLKKGDQVVVEGVIEMDTWDDANSGAKRSKHYLQLSNFKYTSAGSGESGGQSDGLPF